MTRGRDLTVTIGLAVVAVTAIIASFGTLVGLAERVGWGGRTAWLLPCCIDALALSAGRVWLSPSSSPAARRYARAVSLAAVAGSVGGNAVGHLLSTGILTTSGISGTVLVIVVGAVPAVALAAVGYLETMAGAPERAPDTGNQPVPEIGTGTVRKTVSAAVTTGSPAGTVTRSKSRRTSRRSEKQERAWEHWRRERAAGRTPTGRELADAAGADPTMGCRWAREWSAAGAEGAAA